ncbi:MAG: hypothetical protein AABY22_11940 [Nanoarchaeota archaeon]
MNRIIKIKPAYKDERGTITDVVDGINFVHAGIITFEKGVIRGNHYHKKTVQLNYIFKGKIKYLSKDLTNKNAKVEEAILNEGDMIESGVNEWHSLEALEESVLLFFTKETRIDGGYEEDVFRISPKEIENFKLK